MENKRLGGGILLISIFYLVSLVAGINRSIMSLSSLDEINAVSIEAGMRQITSTEIFISIILSSISLIGVIIILFKKKIGIYIFFTGVFINIITLLIMNGISQTTISASLLSLVLPGILAYFIFRKKEIFELELSKK